MLLRLEVGGVEVGGFGEGVEVGFARRVRGLGFFVVGIAFCRFVGRRVVGMEFRKAKLIVG